MLLTKYVYLGGQSRLFLKHTSTSSSTVSFRSLDDRFKLRVKRIVQVEEARNEQIQSQLKERVASRGAERGVLKAQIEKLEGKGLEDRIEIEQGEEIKCSDSGLGI